MLSTAVTNAEWLDSPAKPTILILICRFPGGELEHVHAVRCRVMFQKQGQTVPLLILGEAWINLGSKTLSLLLAKPCVKSTWVVGLTRITVTLVWGVSSNPVFGTGPKFLYESNPCDPVKIWFCTYWFHQVAFPLTDLWSFSFNCFSILVREERNNYSVMKTCWKCTVIRFFF